VTQSPLSRSKGQDQQAALLTAVLARQAAAAFGVGTCWPWETAAALPSARRRKVLRRPRGGGGAGEERGAGISWRSPAYSLLAIALPVTHTTENIFIKFEYPMTSLYAPTAVHIATALS